VKSWIIGAAGHARHAEHPFVRGEKSFDPLLQGFTTHSALLPFDPLIPSTPAANQHHDSPALAAKHSSRSSAAAQGSVPNTTHQGLLAHAEGFFPALLYFLKLPPSTFSQPQHHINSIAGSIHNSFITSC